MKRFQVIGREEKNGNVSRKAAVTPAVDLTNDLTAELCFHSFPHLTRIAHLLSYSLFLVEDGPIVGEFFAR